MSPFAAFAHLLISLVICAALAGTVTAWVWAIGRVWTGRPLLPAPKPHPVPWGIGSVLLVLLAYCVIDYIVARVYLGMTGGLHAQRKLTLIDRMTVGLLLNTVLLVVIPLTLRLTCRAPLGSLGLETRGLARQALAGTTGFLLAAPLVYMVNFLSLKIWEQHKHPLEEMLLAEPNALIAALAFVSAVLIAPAAEELMFRGIIQSWVARLRRLPVQSDAGVAVAGELFPGHWTAAAPEDEVGIDEPPFTDEPPSQAGMPGPRDALAPVVITSALFAAVHFAQWPAPIAIFFLSLGLGLVYQRTGSLFASFLMHALFNGFSTLVLFQTVLMGHPADPKVVPTATYSKTGTPSAAPAAPALTAATGRRW